ncbi:hypothetical protein WISP_112959 [Willisornis vidua]|uniref:Uncharacterized protein n=1 Tax=Willisornis vidua TaxID=1566151 RepID=A0ABQ9D114_9PASS|nr:hypothetical protein WISP_112959 [Willisornis vidua]
MAPAQKPPSIFLADFFCMIMDHPVLVIIAQKQESSAVPYIWPDIQIKLASPRRLLSCVVAFLWEINAESGAGGATLGFKGLDLKELTSLELIITCPLEPKTQITISVHITHLLIERRPFLHLES